MDNNNNNNKNENRRFLAKIKNISGQNGTFQKIYVDNPNPKKKDGTKDTYFKGYLIWYDAETGKKYQIKQMSLRGVSQNAKSNGFAASVCIDLDNAYDITEIK